jgi:hypothetical protein
MNHTTALIAASQNAAALVEILESGSFPNEFMEWMRGINCME